MDHKKRHLTALSGGGARSCGASDDASAAVEISEAGPSVVVLDFGFRWCGVGEDGWDGE